MTITEETWDGKNVASFIDSNVGWISVLSPKKAFLVEEEQKPFERRTAG